MSIKTDEPRQSVRVTLDKNIVKYFNEHEELNLSGTTNMLLNWFIQAPNTDAARKLLSDHVKQDLDVCNKVIDNAEQQVTEHKPKPGWPWK